jgi:hypothetical protein
VLPFDGVRVRSREFEFGFEFWGDAEVQFTSWLFAGAEVPTPAQAASTVTQATAVIERKRIEEKQWAEVSWENIKGDDKTYFYGEQVQQVTESQITQRGRGRKSFKKSGNFAVAVSSIKKSRLGFPRGGFQIFIRNWR